MNVIDVASRRGTHRLLTRGGFFEALSANRFSWGVIGTRIFGIAEAITFSFLSRSNEPKKFTYFLLSLYLHQTLKEPS